MNAENLLIVTITGQSQTLATLGVQLPQNLKRLAFIPQGSAYMAFGAATTSSFAIPSGGIDIPINASNANALQFVGSGTMGIVVVAD